MHSTTRLAASRKRFPPRAENRRAAMRGPRRMANWMATITWAETNPTARTGRWSTRATRGETTIPASTRAPRCRAVIRGGCAPSTARAAARSGIPEGISEAMKKREKRVESPEKPSWWWRESTARMSTVDTPIEVVPAQRSNPPVVARDRGDLAACRGPRPMSGRSFMIGDGHFSLLPGARRASGTQLGTLPLAAGDDLPTCS
jgi:hypothetical protein